MEQIASKFRQLTRTVQRVLVNQVRNIVLTVAMLFGMQIQHKLRQCAVHASNLPFHYHKAGTGQLNCGCKVQARVHFTQRHVVTNFEVKLTRGTPAADFNVVIFIFTYRHFICWQVRDCQRDIANFSL